MSKLDEAMGKLITKRGRPALLMDLREVNHYCLLLLTKELNGKVHPEIDVVLQTPGGNADAAFTLVKILRNHAKKINMIVPLFAKSAGTMMCLSGDTVVLTELSELGPLDTQMPESQDGESPRHASALNGFKALEQIETHAIHALDVAAKLIKSRTGMRHGEAYALASQFCGQTSGTLYSKFDPYKIGEYARALDVGKRYALLILTRYMKWANEKAHSVVNRLVENYPSHEFVIDYEELKDIGLPAELADDELSPLLDDLRDLLLSTRATCIKFYPLPEQIETPEKPHENTPAAE